jgi:hypothetical protein
VNNPIKHGEMKSDVPNGQACFRLYSYLKSKLELFQVEGGRRRLFEAKRNLNNPL